jgi:putative transposase
MPQNHNITLQAVRKHPAHGILLVDGRPTIVFDTICTKNRAPWLAHAAVHCLLCEVWRDATAWLVGRYIIMPDHIHLFAAATEASTVTHDPWVTYWKSQFTKRHRVPGQRWQTDHWDTRIRSAATYEEKWEYVRYNPVRAGLVVRPEDWPFQGVIHEFTWS